MNRERPLQYAAAIALMCLAVAAAAQTQQSKPTQNDQHTAKQQSTAMHPSNQKQSDGQRVFEQNCARCHTPPDGFSPRISGTIVLHMRVRASLSEHDVQELERFLNP